MIVPVILSGGSGTRLWPLSRGSYPKQFLNLAGEHSLLGETLVRLNDIENHAAPVLVCNQEHRFLIAENLRAMEIRDATIILEPVARNTAPAIALAALTCQQQHPENPNPVMLVLAADHIIQNPKALANAVLTGYDRALEGDLVTFGIIPNCPHTGYGYIRTGEPCDREHTSFAVAEFVEKPDQQKAEQYLQSGNYYWNSGMFMFCANRYLEELEKFSPETLSACRLAFENRSPDLDFLRVDEEAFFKTPSNSIDYAVMEKTDAAVIVPLDAGWSDVGSWTALWEVAEKDNAGNAIKGDVLHQDVKSSYIHSESRLIAAIGLEDQIIVETDDALLVAHKDRVQDVKLIVEKLKSSGRQEHQFHSKVYRPWGSYQGITRADRFQVKRIIVDPGQTLSLQMHHHRAEHWIIVKGTAKVTQGEKSFILSEDQSTYIPLGITHRLENPGVIPLELIEVQTGSYLGEDDIVRFQDTYGRIKK